MPESLSKLVNIISYLPGIWDKSATKLAFFLLNSNSSYIDAFSKTLLDLQTNIWRCKNCGSLVDINRDFCDICSNDSRDKSVICVVEEYLDMITIESSNFYKWTYHILGWAISPINGVFIWDLNFERLFERIWSSEANIEIIIATNPNIEWEATLQYILEELSKRWLRRFVSISRLSRWLSSGYIEYADSMTLVNSIKERKRIEV